MKNIHILPTKPNDETGNGIWIEKTRDWCNIFITSDEEIKEEDYALQFHYNKISIVKCDVQNKSVINNKSLDLYATKIILTTDQDLIKDSVQDIPDEFLEWFVKNPSCEEVRTKRIFGMGRVYSAYEIIIPKEDLFTATGLKALGITKEEPKKKFMLWKKVIWFQKKNLNKKLLKKLN